MIELVRDLGTGLLSNKLKTSGGLSNRLGRLKPRPGFEQRPDIFGWKNYDVVENRKFYTKQFSLIVEQ